MPKGGLSKEQVKRILANKEVSDKAKGKPRRMSREEIKRFLARVRGKG